MPDTVLVRANIDLAPGILKSVVQNAKQKYGKSEKGGYRIDTAEELNRLITRFLAEKDFAAYAADPANYAD